MKAANLLTTAEQTRATRVLEMAMRGQGQIAELCRIAEPTVGAITNVGPVHLELLGTIDAIAEAKAEILSGLGPQGRAVVPEDAEALEPHLHDECVTFTFGPGGDVFALVDERLPGGRRAVIGTCLLFVDPARAAAEFFRGQDRHGAVAAAQVVHEVVLSERIAERSQR